MTLTRSSSEARAVWASAASMMSVAATRVRVEVERTGADKDKGTEDDVGEEAGARDMMRRKEKRGQGCSGRAVRSEGGRSEANEEKRDEE